MALPSVDAMGHARSVWSRSTPSTRDAAGRAATASSSTTGPTPASTRSRCICRSCSVVLGDRGRAAADRRRPGRGRRRGRRARRAVGRRRDARRGQHRPQPLPRPRHGPVTRLGDRRCHRRPAVGATRARPGLRRVSRPRASSSRPSADDLAVELLDLRNSGDTAGDRPACRRLRRVHGRAEASTRWITRPPLPARPAAWLVALARATVARGLEDGAAAPARRRRRARRGRRARAPPS